MKEFLKNLLQYNKVYTFFQKAIIKDRVKTFYEPYITLSPAMKILDIGCGPANILKWLPDDVEYIGYDMSSDYIESARINFAHKNATFYNKVVNDLELKVLNEDYFDYVLCLGVLHHISDEEIHKIYAIADAVLKNNGKLITLDCCFLHNQNFIAKYLAANDRGKFVRHYDEFVAIAQNYFGSGVTHSLNQNSLKLPYDLCIIEYTKP